LDLFGGYRWRRQADALSYMEDGGMKERFGNYFNVWSQENGVQLIDIVDLKADLRAYISVSEF
jgi:diadenosine tetraphosphatase ApaH/serine/threonine PP2A family protein phosphatase